jgi:hypothetical protein
VSAGAAVGVEGTGGVAGTGTIVWAMPGAIMQHTSKAAGEAPRSIRFIINRILDLIPGFIIY